MMTLLAVMAVVEPDRVLADFEGKDYGGWVVTGTAFGGGPAHGALPGQMEVSGFEGKGLVTSFVGGDGAVGTLTSPEFVVDRKALAFLVGGGGFEGKTCVNLLVDGKVVRTMSGANTEPGGSERLEWAVWEVSDLAGRRAKVEVVDAATGGWGHINVDLVVLTDAPPRGVVANVSRSWGVEGRYLHLPVKHGGPTVRLELAREGGERLAEFDVAITEGTPDSWVSVDLSRWVKPEDRLGTVSLRAKRLGAGGAALEAVRRSEERMGVEPVYGERLRPQFHFSSRQGWLNDPNGMVYSNGVYHLYYQHNPYGWAWGNMHWGHAVSRDMVHWAERAVALAPKAYGDWAFSGSAVVDAMNTAGWRQGDEEVIVAAYTSTGRGECIVYSRDGGNTFTEFEGNPVVVHAHGEGRDPRLLWYEDAAEAGGGHWVMAVYDEDRKLEEPLRRGIAFYTSPDLKRWELAGRTGGFFECPDLFELPVDGGKGGKKWVLTAADDRSMIGRFDGKVFTPDEMDGGGKVGRKFIGNRSDRFYAAQTFSGVPDGRRVQIGWGRIEMPGMPFNQMMAFPCELTLRTTPEGVRVFAWPVAEIELLYGREWKGEPGEVSPAKPLAVAAEGDLLDVTVEVEFGTAKAVVVKVRGMPVRFEAAGRVVADGRTAEVPVRGGRVRARLLVDRSSVEVFAAEGEFSMLLAGAFSGSGVSVEAEGGAAKVVELRAHELRTTWGPGGR